MEGDGVEGFGLDVDPISMASDLINLACVKEPP